MWWAGIAKAPFAAGPTRGRAAGRESGIAAIELGKSEASLLIRYVSGTDAKLVMPPAGLLLAAAEIAVVREWMLSPIQDLSVNSFRAER